MNDGGESTVLTGCGWVTPFAAGSIADVLTRAAASGAVDAGPARGCGASPPLADAVGSGRERSDAFRAVPDEWVHDYAGLSRELKADKGAWMTAAALIHACREASLDIESLDAERLGLFLGWGSAGQLGMIGFANEVRKQSARFVSPIHFPQTVGNFIAGAIARGFHVRGPNTTFASGSASALDAIIEGSSAIARGIADVVIAGGTEPLSEALARGLAGPDPPLSEGACLFVLERSDKAAVRGANVLATVTSWSHSDQRADGSPDSQRQAKIARAKARGSDLVSVAGWRRPGAVFIEHWIGRCLGASGGAAVAAVIGAAAGRSVPILDRQDPDSVSIGRIAVNDMRGPDGTVPAEIIADADGSHRTTLHIAAPTHI